MYILFLQNNQNNENKPIQNGDLEHITLGFVFKWPKKKKPSKQNVFKILKLKVENDLRKKQFLCSLKEILKPIVLS